MCYITPISIRYVRIGRLIHALQLDMYYFAPKSLVSSQQTGKGHNVPPLTADPAIGGARRDSVVVRMIVYRSKG